MVNMLDDVTIALITSICLGAVRLIYDVIKQYNKRVQERINRARDKEEHKESLDNEPQVSSISASATQTELSHIPLDDMYHQIGISKP